MDTEEIYREGSEVEEAQMMTEPPIPPGEETVEAVAEEVPDLEPEQVPEAGEEEGEPGVEPEVLTSQEAQAELEPDKPEEEPDKTNGAALYVGAVLLVIASAVFAIMKSISQGEPFFEYPAIIFSVMAGVSIFMFHKKENIGFLFAGISLIVGTLCLTLLYYINR